jgi:hypothetical protein
VSRSYTPEFGGLPIAKGACPEELAGHISLVERGSIDQASSGFAGKHLLPLFLSSRIRYGLAFCIWYEESVLTGDLDGAMGHGSTLAGTEFSFGIRPFSFDNF